MKTCKFYKVKIKTNNKKEDIFKNFEKSIKMHYFCCNKIEIHIICVNFLKIKLNCCMHKS